MKTFKTFIRLYGRNYAVLALGDFFFRAKRFFLQKIYSILTIECRFTRKKKTGLGKLALCEARQSRIVHSPHNSFQTCILYLCYETACIQTLHSSLHIITNFYQSESLIYAVYFNLSNTILSPLHTGFCVNVSVTAIDGFRQYSACVDKFACI